MTKTEHKRRHKRKLRAQGLCATCSTPSGGRWRCDDCTRKQTLYQRARRRLKQVQGKYRCSLCMSVGHNYLTCELNADRMHA